LERSQLEVNGLDRVDTTVDTFLMNQQTSS
jgi:hypothetical protein